MAAHDCQDSFMNLSTKFSQLLYGRTEGDRNLINRTLDELNSLDYRYPVVTNNSRAVLLVNQLCSLVPPDDPFLVAKCCTMITNLVSRQRVAVEGRTLTLTIEWIVQALKQTDDVVQVDVLVTLEALIRSNVQSVCTLLPCLVATDAVLVELAAEGRTQEVGLLAVQCLEALCAVPENFKSTENEKCRRHREICSKVFLDYLSRERDAKFEELIYLKLLISCIKGLQNIVIQDNDFLRKELEILLGIAKSFMVYNLKGIEFLKADRIMPSPLSVPEPSPNKPREKKGGKVTRQRKQRPSASYRKEGRRSNGLNESFEPEDLNGGYIPATTNFETLENLLAVQPTCKTNLKTSDSDFSDSEVGKTAKLSVMEGRVRQATLSLLLNICKLTDKRTMFSYWSSFIPDAPLSGSHSLTNCILKDPSPRGRMAALNVLLVLLTSSKLYLSQAEYSVRTSSFTPFSVTLGFIIKELHHCLSLALNESSYPVLTQALKCMATLVQATPYHRLTPGLTNKVIRNVKSFIYHKDTTVQVAALIVLGCTLASEPTVKETKDALLKNHKSNKSPSPKKEDVGDFEFADFSSEDEESDDGEAEDNVPWLLARCVKNLNDGVPAPVKLESLQVISAMCRNYFEALILPYIHHITKALETALTEKYVDVRLHAGRTVDFVGLAVNQYINNNTDAVSQGVTFWQALLGGPLLSLLQCEQLPMLRAIGCDCIGSVGPRVFEQLPREKQLLCITSLFSCSRDEDAAVRGSAVRALAVSVLYPSLREDVGFIMDTCEAIHRTLKDENIALRVKSSWSMGNLSDALVLNKTEPTVQEEIPDSLFLSLVELGIACCVDNEKIRSNGVRALGNLLSIIGGTLMEREDFSQAVVKAVAALVKCSSVGSNMKVRWNACYALQNVLKNPALYTPGNGWLKSVFTTLGDLVINFKNFKVRINAALALSACPSRESYGTYYLYSWNCLIKALENSENMEDFSEYKHRDHLIEQICLSLGHLVSLVRTEDLLPLKDTFSESALQAQTRRVYDRVIPEKSSVLFSAREHLLTFDGLNSEQEEVRQSLQNVFENEV